MTYTTDTVTAAQPATQITSLQILRAVAATSVVYLHIGATPNFGSFGVDIFFVISGYVMAMLVGRKQDATHFLLNRCIRIIPLYWILTTGVLVLAAVKPELLNSTTANLSHYLKSIFFIPYFKESGALHPMLTVGWTLNYEMFFYLCVWLSMRLRRHAFMPICSALIIAFYCAARMSDNPVFSSFFGNAIVFEFLFGMGLYTLRNRAWVRRTKTSIGLCLIVLSLSFMAFIEVQNTQIPRVFIYGLPAVVLVMAALEIEKRAVRTNQILVAFLTGLGDASYATYLCHYYIVEGIKKIIDQKLHLFSLYTPMGIFIAIACSLAGGHILYHCLDKPLGLFLKKKIAGKSFAMPQHG